ncbi:MAG: YjgN family protein [Alphaproteobacteria bacterium]
MEQAAEAPATVPPAAKPALKVNRLTYCGKTGALYGVWVKQLLLTIITLGIYRCWGKTNIRRYLFAATELDGDRFEYLGTGKELFMGILKIIPGYLVVVGIYAYLNSEHPGLGSVVFIPFIYLIPVFMYSGYRYRVNRTQWRGIRSRMGGSAFAYGGKYLGGMFIQLFTLGLMAPSVDLKRWEYQASHMQFGTVPFRFKGDPAKLRAVNITTLLLAIPTLFMSRLWYKAALEREKMRGLALAHVRFRLTAKAGDYIWLALGNFGLILITLGFGAPLVMNRNMHFLEKHMALGGDLAAFNAEQVALGGAGDAEGLADVFDVDLGIAG